MKKAPGTYRHGNLREALVEDAIRLLHTQTAADLSVRELAERAGVSPRAPYVHFASKQELLAAVATKGFEDLAVAGQDAEGDLYRLGEIYIRHALDHPNLHRLMFGGLVEPVTEKADASFQQVLRAIRGRQPEWDEERVHAAGLALWGFVHGLAELRLNQMISTEVWEVLPLRHLAALLSEVLQPQD